jgi:hypothetical protein
MTKKELEKRNRELEKLLGLKGIEAEKDKKPEKIKVSFSKATEKKLEECVNIKRNFIAKNKFKKWFNNKIKISN